jgi:hypothetical protein
MHGGTTIKKRNVAVNFPNFVLGRHLLYIQLNYVGVECLATLSLEEQQADLLLVVCQSILCGRSHHLYTESEEAFSDCNTLV